MSQETPRKSDAIERERKGVGRTKSPSIGASVSGACMPSISFRIGAEAATKVVGDGLATALALYHLRGRHWCVG